MSGDSDISLIVPAFNAARFLPDALASVVGQTLRPREVIVVNDGSSDDTAAVARGFAADSPFAVRVIDQENGGPAVARNTGIRAAQGKWLAFLDADDLLLPECLGIYDDTARRFPDCEWFGADCTVVDEACQAIEPARLPRQDLRRRLLKTAYEPERPARLSAPFSQLLQNCLIPCCQTLVSKSLCLAHGGFDEAPLVRSAEDYQLWIRLSLDNDLVFIPKPVALYRHHPESLTSQDTAPRVATIEAFERLTSYYGIDRELTLINRRLSVFHMQNAYYYRKKRRIGEAFGSSLEALRHDARNRKAWRNLIAATLRR